MVNASIRQATFEDSRGIAELHIKTWQHAYRGQMPDSYLDSLSVDERAKKWNELLDHPNERSVTFVADLDGKIVGFCSVGASRDAGALDDIGELGAIYIDPNFSGQGIGSMLLSAGKEHLKQSGFRKAMLWVLESNKIARLFYEHKGWMADGASKTEQRDGFELKEVRYLIDL